MQFERKLDAAFIDKIASSIKESNDDKTSSQEVVSQIVKVRDQIPARALQKIKDVAKAVGFNETEAIKMAGVNALEYHQWMAKLWAEETGVNP